MTTVSSGLLPEGLRDVLPPYAEAEAMLLRQILDVTASHGYERVSPPLVEFQSSLVGRLGAERARDLFRFIDPLSNDSLGLRADLTEQVARIASTRLAHLARPVRLSYGGPVLRVQGTQLRPDRQATQVGAELIGTASIAAVAEVLCVALAGLKTLGLEALSLDFVMPAATAALIEQFPETDRPLITAALDAKDLGTLNACQARNLAPLITQAGLAAKAIPAVRSAALGAAFNAVLDDIAAVAEGVQAQHGDVQMTLDPAERHGFAYQSWIGFSFFCAGVRDEIGRGGAYSVLRATGESEPAVGFSIYLDGLVDAGRGVQSRQRVFLPFGTAHAVRDDLAKKGYVTIAGLEPGDNHAQAHAQRCDWVWSGNTLVAVTE